MQNIIRTLTKWVVGSKNRGIGGGGVLVSDSGVKKASIFRWASPGLGDEAGFVCSGTKRMKHWSPASVWGRKWHYGSVQTQRWGRAGCQGP